MYAFKCRTFYFLLPLKSQSILIHILQSCSIASNFFIISEGRLITIEGVVEGETADDDDDEADDVVAHDRPTSATSPPPPPPTLASPARNSPTPHHNDQQRSSPVNQDGASSKILGMDLNP